MDGKTKEKLFTEQGRDTPVPVGKGGGKAGPTRPSSSVRGESQVGIQAWETPYATGSGGRSELGGRKTLGTSPNCASMDFSWNEELQTSIQDAGKNTPDKNLRLKKINMFSDLKRSFSLGAEDLKKRKRSSYAPQTEQILKKKENPAAFVLIEAVQSAISITKDLVKKVEENPNTKREIKDLVSKLIKCMGAANMDTVRQWLEDNRFEKVDVPTYETETQTASPTIVGTNRVERAVQTEMRRDWSRKLRTLEGVSSLEEWRGVEPKDWDKEVFTCTEIKRGGNPLESKDCVTKVVWVDSDDPLMDRGVPRKFRDRYPELVEAGDYEVIEEVRTRKCQEASVRNKIIKVGFDGTDEDAWLKCHKLKYEAEGSEWVAMNSPKAMPPARFRKMVECVFQRGNTRLRIYTSGGLNPGRVPADHKKKVEKKSYALVVGSKDKNYKEVLEQVKNVISHAGLSNAVRGLRSTREGRLLVEMDKDESDAVKMQESLREEGSLDIRRLGPANRLAMLHIRGMDELTTKDDILRALEGKIGSLKDKTFRISDLRPNARNTMAATIAINNLDAENLEQDANLRVGMVLCSIERRVNLRRCHRCWSYDHIAAQCSGPDRSNLCYRCGGEGHSSKACQEVEACPLCNVVGHKADSGRCPAFRKALATAKKSRGLPRSNSARPATSRGNSSNSCQGLQGTEAVRGPEIVVTS